MKLRVECADCRSLLDFYTCRTPNGEVDEIYVQLCAKCVENPKGYDDGYADGYNVGRSDGDWEGYNRGHDEGYEDGYSDGLLGESDEE